MVGGGLAGSLAGPGGAFAGGVAGGQAMDGVLTALDSGEKGAFTPYGTWGTVTRIAKGEAKSVSGELFDLVGGVVGDGVTGHTYNAWVDDMIDQSVQKPTTQTKTKQTKQTKTTKTKTETFKKPEAPQPEVLKSAKVELVDPGKPPLIETDTITHRHFIPEQDGSHVVLREVHTQSQVVPSQAVGYESAFERNLRHQVEAQKPAVRPKSTGPVYKLGKPKPKVAEVTSPEVKPAAAKVTQRVVVKARARPRLVAATVSAGGQEGTASNQRTSGKRKSSARATSRSQQTSTGQGHSGGGQGGGQGQGNRGQGQDEEEQNSSDEDDEDLSESDEEEDEEEEEEESAEFDGVEESSDSRVGSYKRVRRSSRSGVREANHVPPKSAYPRDHTLTHGGQPSVRTDYVHHRHVMGQFGDSGNSLMARLVRSVTSEFLRRGDMASALKHSILVNYVFNGLLTQYYGQLKKLIKRHRARGTLGQGEDAIARQVRLIRWLRMRRNRERLLGHEAHVIRDVIPEIARLWEDGGQTWSRITEILRGSFLGLKLDKFDDLEKFLKAVFEKLREGRRKDD